MAGRIRTIVVGVATVHRQDPVLFPAVELAESLGAVLHVVHAYTPRDPLLHAYAELGQTGRYARDLSHSLAMQVERLSPRGRVVSRAIHGAAAPVLEQVAEEVRADLVIVGATRRGAVARAVLGTTCQQVLRAVRAPILMLRASPVVRVRRVLLTTDLSALSGEVSERGAELARELAGDAVPEFRLIYADDERAVPFPPFPELPTPVGEREIAEFLAGRTALPPGLETRVRVGDPAAAIAAEAAEWGAELIVLGTHARRGAARLLLGSVAESVLRLGPCNALVIPARALGLLTGPEVEVELTGPAS